MLERYRSILNKKNELDIMVDEIKPHIIGITESWANNDIAHAEFGLEGFVMFTKDGMKRRGGGVLLYINELYQHMKYSYRRNQIIMMQCCAN